MVLRMVVWKLEWVYKRLHGDVSGCVKDSVDYVISDVTDHVMGGVVCGVMGGALRGRELWLARLAGAAEFLWFCVGGVSA